ncbi:MULTISPECIES: hypothetical protein [unclassified Inquilinus]|uniref:hypothetical protein n=1 Tax=unclassified Inquilinus TaxID=2645927 RepID=UPI003F8F9717
MRLLVVGLMLAALTAPALAAEATPKVPLKCDFGPLHKTFGGGPWQLYSCSDHSTLVIAADIGNPAHGFYFMLYLENGIYQLYGEGNGKKEFTAAAFEELKALGTDQIAALIRQTLGD